MERAILITGTDTGVGKTAVTALLLAHAQAEGIRVRALKPFSTGGQRDEALLAALQSNAFPTNFFHYPEPIAPWAAARLHDQPVRVTDVVSKIAPHLKECDLLLVEGAGGLLTPLGEDFNAADLMTALSADPLLVAANRLGVLNHTLLAVEALRNRSAKNVRIALVEQAAADQEAVADLSRKTNLANLRELVPSIPIVPIVPIPCLPNYAADAEFIRRAAAQLRPVLSELLAYKKNPPDTEAEGTFP
jgi:dethiobiotin synthetase